MNKDKKEQTFKDLLSNLQEQDEKIDFNQANEISKEEKKESFNNLFQETKSSESQEDFLNNIINETPSLIKPKEEQEPKEEKPVLIEKEEPKEENNSNPFFSNKIEEKNEKIENEKKEDNPFFSDNKEEIKLDDNSLSKEEQEDEEKIITPNQEEIFGKEQNICMTQIPLNLVFSSLVGFEHSLDSIKQTLLNKSRLMKSFSFTHLKVFIEYLDVS